MLHSSVDDLENAETRSSPARNAGAVAKPSQAEPRRFALFDTRPLFGESLACWLRGLDQECGVATFRDIDKLLDCVASGDPLDLLLFSVRLSEFPQVFAALDKLASLSPSVPSIVVSASEDPKAALELIRHGARGFIPVSLDLTGASAVLDFVIAGGTFLPAALFLEAGLAAVQTRPSDGAEAIGFAQRHQACDGSMSLPLAQAKLPVQSLRLTDREAKVLDCLCRGKPNKLIAYELTLCESTVKMYIGRLMRKLNARNRTELALSAERLLKEPETSTVDEVRALYSVQPVRI
jgi:DNA-binding NarL/FixJ family response regulator